MKESTWCFLVLVVPTILCGSGCSSGGGGGGGGTAVVIQGSGVIVEENRSVSGFVRVVHASEGALFVAQGATESLRIRADDNLLQYLLTTVQGGVLELRTANLVDLRPTQPIELHLTLTSLKGMDFSGIGSVTVSDVSTNRLALTCSGIGKAILSNLTATELEVELDGIGEVRASGTLDRQTVTLTGFGAYEARDLQSRETDVRVRGQQDATVRVSDRLVVTITSSGSVYYIGSPTVDATITGSGQVVQIGTGAPSDPPWFLGSRPPVPFVIPNAYPGLHRRRS